MALQGLLTDSVEPGENLAQAIARAPGAGRPHLPSIFFAIRSSWAANPLKTLAFERDGRLSLRALGNRRATPGMSGAWAAVMIIAPATW